MAVWSANMMVDMSAEKMAVMKAVWLADLKAVKKEIHWADSKAALMALHWVVPMVEALAEQKAALLVLPLAVLLGTHSVVAKVVQTAVKRADWKVDLLGQNSAAG